MEVESCPPLTSSLLVLHQLLLLNGLMFSLASHRLALLLTGTERFPEDTGVSGVLPFSTVVKGKCELV